MCSLLNSCSTKIRRIIKVGINRIKAIKVFDFGIFARTERKVMNTVLKSIKSMAPLIIMPPAIFIIEFPRYSVTKPMKFRMEGETI